MDKKTLITNLRKASTVAAIFSFVYFILANWNLLPMLGLTPEAFNTLTGTLMVVLAALGFVVPDNQ